MDEMLTTTVDAQPLVGPREDPVKAWKRHVAKAHELAGHLAAVHANLVELTRLLIANEAWVGIGIRSLEHWLQVFVGISPAHAANITLIARRAEELPELTQALSAGRIGLDQATVVAQHTPAEYSASVTAFAENATVTQLRRTLPRYSYADAKPQEPRDAAHADTPQLQCGTDSRTGTFHLSFSCNAVDGALVETAIREAKDALFTAGDSNATLADGLLEMANRSLHAVASGSRKDHYRIQLHLDTTGAGWLGKQGALPQHILSEFTCDGKLVPVWETDSHPVSVGRSQRIVPIRTRRLIEDRDRGCRYPGCPVTGFLENHHLQHWRDGGPTDHDTLISLCPRHHRQHHQGWFSIRGNPNQPDGLIFTTPSGIRIGADADQAATAATQLRGHHPPSQYRGPTGERLDPHAVYFSPNAPPLAA